MGNFNRNFMAFRFLTSFHLDYSDCTNYAQSKIQYKYACVYMYRKTFGVIWSQGRLVWEIMYCYHDLCFAQVNFTKDQKIFIHIEIGK